MSARRRAVGAAIASVIVLVAITGVILYFGFLPVPEFVSLGEIPDPALPGTVAFHSQGDPGHCLQTVAASGGPVRELTCRLEFSGQIAWTASGNLVLEDYSGPQPHLVVLDPNTGSELYRIESPEGGLFELVGDRSVRADSSQIRFDSRGEGSAQVLVQAPDGTRTTVIDVSGAPRDYHFFEWGHQWSPDGAWIAVWDSANRLLIVAEDGNPPARVLVETEAYFGESAWYIPGNSTYTVEVP